MSITQAKLKEILHYDPETGVFTWKVCLNNRAPVGTIAGSPVAQGYIRIGFFGTGERAHRLAFLYTTGSLPLGQVDHIDGDYANNSWSNLRQCSASQNQMNRGTPSNNTSGVKGVRWCPDNRNWRVQVCCRGKCYSGGRFSDIEDAMESAVALRERLHGEFSCHG